jgi:predicted small lipoprotein YifL
MPTILTSLVLAVMLMLAGCGQMGPLYEPEDTPTTATTAAPTA